MGLTAAGYLLVSSIVSAAATGYSAYQSYQTGKYNAKVQEQQADIARSKAAYDENLHRQRVKQLLSKQRALYGKAGVDATTGSPLLTLEDTAGQGELDALAIRYGGDVDAARARSEANISRMGATSSLVSGGLQAGSSLLTGYGRYKRATG